MKKPGIFHQGDIVRHSNGPTAISRLEARHANGWHAKHCLGGFIHVADHNIKHATEADIKEAKQSRYYSLD